MWKTAFLFFFLSEILSRNLRFLSKFGPKNSRCFLKTAKYVRRRAIWYLFAEERLFHFSTLSRRPLNFEQHFTVENLIFSFLVCRGHLVLFSPKNYVFLKCESKSFRRRPKTIWASFWKCIKNVQKNVLVVFSSKNLSIFSDPKQFFLVIEIKIFGIDLKGAEYVCKGKKMIFFCQWNVFLILYFNRETFRIWAKISNKIFFRHFSCPEVLLVLFSRNIGIFLDCEPKCYSFGRQVFNRVFESALKMRTTAYLFFLDSLEFFFFIAVSWAEIFQTLRKTLSEKYFSISFSLCRGHLVLFTQKITCLFRAVRVNIPASIKNVSAVILKVNSRCLVSRSSWFFPPKSINFLGLRTSFSRSLV